MAITVNIDRAGNHYLGSIRMVIASIDLDSSYTNGGYSLTPSMLGLATIVDLNAKPRAGVAFDYDYTNKTLKCFVPGVSVGVAGAATIDDFPINGLGGTSGRSIGMDSSAGGTAVRFGVELEAANGTNLSTITGVRVVVLGY